jgi:hypothetical protein
MIRDIGNLRETGQPLGQYPIPSFKSEWELKSANDWIITRDRIDLADLNKVVFPASRNPVSDI